MRTVHWNPLARIDYYENIDYLLREWSEKEAQKFIDAVHETEFILKQGIVDFQSTDIPYVRRCVICKQISLFYRIIDNKNIEFLRFWNNYQQNRKFNF